MNERSPHHPHEPAMPPAFDADGRCLVCVLTVQLADTHAELERLRAENERLRGGELRELLSQWLEHFDNNEAVGLMLGTVSATRAALKRIEEEVILTPEGAKIISLYPAEELPIANKY